jgi:hypothetical protein
MTERRGRRRKELLDNLKETRVYWKLREEALDRAVWRTRFVYGVIVFCLSVFHYPNSAAFLLTSVQQNSLQLVRPLEAQM